VTSNRSEQGIRRYIEGAKWRVRFSAPTLVNNKEKRASRRPLQPLQGERAVEESTPSESTKNLDLSIIDQPERPLGQRITKKKKKTRMGDWGPRRLIQK